MSETDQGILTEIQREWLQSENPNEEYTAQQRYRRRQGVRQRVRNAMGDIFLLARELPREEFQEIFDVEGMAETVYDADEDRPPWNLSDNPDLAFPYLIEFLLRATDLDDYPVFPSMGADQPAFRDFTRVIERGTESFLTHQKRMVADVSIDIKLKDARPIDELVEQANNSEEVEYLNKPMALPRLASVIDSDEDLEALIEARDRQLEDSESRDS